MHSLELPPSGSEALRFLPSINYLGSLASGLSPGMEATGWAAPTWAASLGLAPPQVGPAAQAPGWGGHGFPFLGLGCPAAPPSSLGTKGHPAQPQRLSQELSGWVASPGGCPPQVDPEGTALGAPLRRRVRRQTGP